MIRWIFYILFAICMIFSGSIAPEWLALEYKNPWWLSLHIPVITWLLYETYVRKDVHKIEKK